MLGSIYHMTLRVLKSHILGVKMSRFCHFKPDIKRRKPGFLFISLQVGSLFKL